MTDVRFVDLAAQYHTIKDEIQAALTRVLDNTSFIMGEPVKTFEQQFAEFCETAHAVGCGNGTDAIYLALRALGIGPDSEVITVPNTFIGTTEPITLTGAKPVFVDVEESTGLMDPTLVEAAITDRTAALMPVHLFGHVAPMEALCAIGERHQLPVVEDAAQAHGARLGGRRVGTFGRCTAFSFYPGKNLGAYGDGGAVVTDSAELAKTIAMLRNHGRTDKYVHEIEGVNSRLDALQAAVLSVKLAHLEQWNGKRREHAARYCSLLSGVEDLQLPPLPDHADAEPVWHLFVVRTPRRDHLQKALREAGVACGVHYPIPLHLQPAYGFLGYERGSFPVAERLAETSLSLPMFPELTVDQIEQVSEAVIHALK